MLMGESKYDFCSYIDSQRWQIFYQQIRAVLALRPRKVLEIGPGPGVVSWALRRIGIEVVTFDNLPALNPDLIGDIRELSVYVGRAEFDLVCCFQVLEHLPFKEVDGVLSQIAGVTSDYALISVPYVGYTVGAAIWVARYGHRQLQAACRIPMFWKTHEFDGEHFWELGKRGYTFSKMSAHLEKHFLVVKKSFMRPDLSQVLYVLRKKGRR